MNHQHLDSSVPPFVVPPSRPFTPQSLSLLFEQASSGTRTAATTMRNTAATMSTHRGRRVLHEEYSMDEKSAAAAPQLHSSQSDCRHHHRRFEDEAVAGTHTPHHEESDYGLAPDPCSGRPQRFSIFTGTGIGCSSPTGADTHVSSILAEIDAHNEGILQEIERIASVPEGFPSVVEFNVGGEIFAVSTENLKKIPASLLFQISVELFNAKQKQSLLLEDNKKSNHPLPQLDSHHEDLLDDLRTKNKNNNGKKMRSDSVYITAAAAAATPTPPPLPSSSMGASTEEQIESNSSDEICMDQGRKRRRKEETDPIVTIPAREHIEKEDIEESDGQVEATENDGKDFCEEIRSSSKPFSMMATDGKDTREPCSSCDSTTHAHAATITDDAAGQQQHPSRRAPIAEAIGQVGTFGGRAIDSSKLRRCCSDALLTPREAAAFPGSSQDTGRNCSGKGEDVGLGQRRQQQQQKQYNQESGALDVAFPLDVEGRPFFDRDPETFRYLLLILRGYKLASKDVPRYLQRRMEDDAEFYGTQSLFDTYFPPSTPGIFRGAGSAEGGLLIKSSTILATATEFLSSGCHTISYFMEEVELVGVGVISPLVTDFGQECGNIPGTAMYFSNGLFQRCFPEPRTEETGIEFRRESVIVVRVDFDKRTIQWFNGGGTDAGALVRMIRFGEEEGKKLAMAVLLKRQSAVRILTDEREM